MDKPPDDTAEQADICCELGVLLPHRMQFFPIYQKSSWLTGKKNVLHGPICQYLLYASIVRQFISDSAYVKLKLGQKLRSHPTKFFRTKPTFYLF